MLDAAEFGDKYFRPADLLGTRDLNLNAVEESLLQITYLFFARASLKSKPCDASENQYTPAPLPRVISHA